MPQQKTVNVRLAYAFDCPNCGALNFVEAVVHEFSGEEQAEAEQELGELPRTGEWLTHPEHVKCCGCGADFAAVNPGEEVNEKKLGTVDRPES